MRNGLRVRVNLISLLCQTANQYIKQVPPGQPTNLVDALKILRAGMKALAARLSDPEAPPTVLTQDQLKQIWMKNDEVTVRAANLTATIDRIGVALLTDESGNEVAGWTQEQLDAANAHIEAQIQALIEKIEAL